jgi:hypothetical protein
MFGQDNTLDDPLGLWGLASPSFRLKLAGIPKLHKRRPLPRYGPADSSERRLGSSWTWPAVSPNLAGPMVARWLDGDVVSKGGGGACCTSPAWGGAGRRWSKYTAGERVPPRSLDCAFFPL